jgi:hypothetical protein
MNMPPEHNHGESSPDEGGRNIVEKGRQHKYHSEQNQPSLSSRRKPPGQRRGHMRLRKMVSQKRKPHQEPEQIEQQRPLALEMVQRIERRGQH